MRRKKKSEFKFWPEQIAVWNASPKLTLCPKYRNPRIGFDKAMAHIKRDDYGQCRAVYLQFEREQELIRFLRSSRN